MGSLKNILESQQPRERSGGWTTARYAFQVHFAILEMIELHKVSQNYCVLMDYFDDIIVLEDYLNLNTAKFYQIKAKATGVWSMAKFCQLDAKKPAPTSIIGKIQFNVSDFGENISQSIFASNASFKFKLVSGKHSVDDDFSIDASDLHDDEIKKINKALDFEKPQPRTPDCKQNLSFRRIALGTHEQHKFVIGALTEYLAQRKKHNDVPAIGVYETLHARIVQKSSVTKTLNSITEIAAEKGIHGKEFESLVVRAVQSKRILEDWSLIEKEFLLVMSPIQVARFKTECLRFIHERANGDPEASSLSSHFRKLAEEQTEQLKAFDSFVEIRDYLLSMSQKWSTSTSSFVKAAALIEAYEEVVSF